MFLCYLGPREDVRWVTASLGVNPLVLAITNVARVTAPVVKEMPIEKYAGPSAINRGRRRSTGWRTEVTDRLRKRVVVTVDADDLLQLSALQRHVPG